MTRSELMEKTVAELRGMCVKAGIKGMTKKRKDIIVGALMENQTPSKSIDKKGKVIPSKKKGGHTAALSKAVTSGPVTEAEFQMSSVMTKPGGRSGDKCTTAIQVQCGANSGKFPVIGKTVGAVAEFLREVLNVDRLAEGLVNGEKVKSSYILTSDDTLEFLKPAGRKGQ